MLNRCITDDFGNRVAPGFQQWAFARGLGLESCDDPTAFSREDQLAGAEPEGWIASICESYRLAAAAGERELVGGLVRELYERIAIFGYRYTSPPALLASESNLLRARADGCARYAEREMEIAVLNGELTFPRSGYTLPIEATYSRRQVDVELAAHNAHLSQFLEEVGDKGEYSGRELFTWLGFV